MLDATVQIVQAAGAVATAVSVIWAIYVYRTNRQKDLFLQSRQTMDSLRRKVRELDGMLSEPKFSLVGQCIADRLRKLKPGDWTFQQFAEYLGDKANHNSIAQAIQVGRLGNTFIDRVEQLIEDVRQSTTPLKQELPVLALVMDKTLFYIWSMARNVLSPRLFDSVIGNPRAIQEQLIAKLSNFKSEEDFFSNLALLASAGPDVALSMKHGQRLFNEAHTVLIALVDTFSAMTDNQLRKTSKVQRSNYTKARAVHNEHAIEDAVEMLQYLRPEFAATTWDVIVECKARIVNLMDSTEEQSLAVKA